MGIFIQDYREFKAEVAEAIDRPDDSGLRDELLLSMDVHKIQMDRDLVVNSIEKLVRANNRPRAHKLIGAVNDFEVHLWVRLFFRAMRKLVFLAVVVGIVWAGVALYHWGV